MDLGSHRATKGPTLQGRPPDDTIAGRAQSDELDGAAVTSATLSQQSHSKEARLADNQATAVTVAPSRGRPTTAGRRNANELGFELDSRSHGDQKPTVGVDNPRHTTTRLIPSTGSSSVSASRGPQAIQNERITSPGSISSSASMKFHTQSHPAAIPSSSGIAPPTRASQEADSKTSQHRPPQVEEQEKRNRSPPPQTGFAHEMGASRPSAEQVERTASVQSSAKPFAHPSPSLNRPSVSTSPSSFPAAQTLIKTASNRTQVVRGTLRDEPQARSGTALSELVPPDEDERKAPPYEKGPKNPLGTPAKLPQPPGHTPSIEPLSRHQPVPKPGHLSRSHSRIQGNEGGDREDKRTKGGTNPQKERQLPVTPDERRTHLEDTVKASGNTPHVRSELTSASAHASGIAPSLIPPPLSSVDRLNTSSRYGSSTARLPDTNGSQGKVGQSVDSEPHLGKQETAHAPSRTSAGSHSTQDQPKPVIRAPADNSKTVPSVLKRRPSVGDTDIPRVPSPPHHESSGPVPTVTSPSTKGDDTSLKKIGTKLVDDAGHVQQSGTGTPPSLNDKAKGRATGGTEPLPERLVEFVRDVINSPDEYKGIVSNEKGSTDTPEELKGLLPSSDYTKSTVMTSPTPQHNSPTAFRAVPSSSSDFSRIIQSGGMLKQVNATNPKLRSGIALPNSALSPMAVETSRSSSRSSKMDIQTKPGDKTITTQPHPLQTPQPLATPTQQPTETRTHTSPLGRNGMPADGGAPGAPGDGPSGPPGDGSPGSHRDGIPGAPRRHRPTATPTEGPRPAASTGSPERPKSSGGGCCSCILSLFK